MIEYYDMMRIQGRSLDISTRNKMMQLCLTCVNSYAAAGGHLVPKFHLWVHLTYDMTLHGNARWQPECTTQQSR
jgi:hypothetical protein